jgi:TM2 domain-containing membrane protein YozV
MALLLLIPGGHAFAGGPYQEHVDGTVVIGEMFTGSSDSTRSENTRLIAGGLAVVLGPFGAHRLYLGTSAKVAVVYGLTFGGFGVLALIDLGHILFTKDLGRFRDNDHVFMWTRERVPTPP